MSMTEPTITPPKPKRKPRRKRRAAAKATPKAPAAPKQPDIYAGLTASQCPAACSPAGCVITGNPRCGHPRKGGLQGREMHDHAVVARFAEARKRLMHADIDKKVK